jgi:hypothetical protein
LSLSIRRETRSSEVTGSLLLQRATAMLPQCEL